MKNRKMQEPFDHLSKIGRACVRFISASGVLILAGCSTGIKESDYKFAEDDGAKVTFSAVIDEQQGDQLNKTRATETNWEVGDRVGGKSIVRCPRAPSRSCPLKIFYY